MNACLFKAALVAASAVVVAIAWLERLSLPSHLLGHPFKHTQGLLTVDQAVRLRSLAKSMTFEMNTVSSVVPNITHEHVGEAEPVMADGRCEHKLLVPSQNRSMCVLAGRADVGSHFIKTGGFDGLKENYLDMVSRVLSFGAFIFQLDADPIFRELFEGHNFQAAARSVCPADQQILDPFQFNIIMQVPGQTVALHIDSVHFLGANRFKFPEWLLAAMKFSGFWEDKFVHQVQTVSYFHEEDVGDRAGGNFVLYDSNGPPSSIAPKSRDALSVDGSKTVHAATVFHLDRKPPRIDRSVRTVLRWRQDLGKWSVETNSTQALFSDSEVRMSIVFRARCFQSEEQRAAFWAFDVNGPDSITLEDVLHKFREDLLRRGRLSQSEHEDSMHPGKGRLILALRILDFYINYPLPQQAWIPFNWCAIATIRPELDPLLQFFGC